MDAQEEQQQQEEVTTTPSSQLPSPLSPKPLTVYTYPKFKKRYRVKKTQIQDSPEELQEPQEPSSELVVYEKTKKSRSNKQKRLVVNDFYENYETKPESSTMERAEEIRSNLDSKFPSFAKTLVRSNVTVGFWMHLPMKFCKVYLPKSDTTVFVETENGAEFIINYIAERTALSGGWKAFIGSNSLLEGDVLIFHLVKPLRFKVYIVRGNGSPVIEGDIGIQNGGVSEMQVNEDQADTELGTDKKVKNNELVPVEPLEENNQENGLKALDNITRQAPNEFIRKGDDCGSENLQVVPSGGSNNNFEDIKGLEDFSILVNGLVIDSELSDHCRTKYYELCRSQNSFLHENLLNSINYKLAAEIIIGTVNIAEAIRTCTHLLSASAITTPNFNSMDSDFGIPRELSDLQKLRSLYHPELPPCLQGTTVRVEFGDGTTTADPADAHSISRSFPHTYGQPLAHFLRATAKVPDAQIITEHLAIRVGILFCGRQSPGGHNVIWGLYNALKIHNPNNVLLGFLGGSEGLFAQKTLEITDDILSTYKNQGGYDLLGRTKDQIRTTEQVNAALKACNDLKLDGLVIIGGVTSNTDAAQLAETFAEAKCPTKVVGVPVTLNGDLKNQFVETNVGFDTICKVNSQLISNVCTDALSAEKYYYFIRLMGRKASHVALECTLQSHPNMVILGEEVAASKLTLFDLTTQICDAVQARAKLDKYHGVILLPEGLIESIPEVYALLKEIHGLLRQGVTSDNIYSKLSPWASALFEFLPPFIKKQLLLFPESDDSAQLSQIETEKLLAHLVETEMNKRMKEGTYKGKKFNAICHFFGYQARGSVPSKFDCDYAYVLGHICYHILAAGLNGYMATVTNLKNPVNKWRCGAAPITAMMTVKRWAQSPGASSIGKPAIHPATVDLKGKAYELLRSNAMKFLLEDVYRNPGPLQFDGPGSDSKSVTLCVEDQDYMGRIKKLQEYLDKVRTIVKPGCSQDVLKAALSVMASVTEVLSVMSSTSNNNSHSSL